MARLPITIYKKSALATLVSFCTVFFYAFALVALFSMQWVVLIICILGGIGTTAWAESINDKKIFKLWIKDLEAKGIRDIVVSSTEQAIALYNANPSKLTLKYIEKNNPYAGSIITLRIAERKKAK